MIVSSALPLFIQFHSPREEDSFILECAEDCGFRDMSEVEGRGDDDYDTTQTAILEFATRLLHRQRLLERLVVLCLEFTNHKVQIYGETEGKLNGQLLCQLPASLIDRYKAAQDIVFAHRAAVHDPRIMHWRYLFEIMSYGNPERQDAMRHYGSTYPQTCIQFLLNDILAYDPAFADMREWGQAAPGRAHTTS